MVDDPTGYLARLREQYGDTFLVDVFDMIRTLEQRIGFGLWIGMDAAQDGTWQRLKEQFDVLSQKFAFVSPKDTLVSGKARERVALEQLYVLLEEIHVAREGKAGHENDALTLLYEKFPDSDAATQQRKVAHNVINANQGFLSNLYAAIAWVIVRLLQHGEVLAKVRDEIGRTEAEFGPGFLHEMDALNSMQYLEQVLMESVRMAQRSITLCKVLKPVEFDDGTEVYAVQPGAYITTLLSVTNMQTVELKRFDPDHYQGNRLRPDVAEAGKDTVSTFGHGTHACPAQKLSHTMCKIVVARLLAEFDLEAAFDDPQPSASQLGGVARPGAPAAIRYASRAVCRQSGAAD